MAGIAIDMDAVQRVNAALEHEGWAIFEVGLGEFELQRDDGMAVFSSDRAALAHVQSKARAGSELHAAALRIVGLEISNDEVRS